MARMMLSEVQGLGPLKASQYMGEKVRKKAQELMRDNCGYLVGMMFTDLRQTTFIARGHDHALFVCLPRLPCLLGSCMPR